MNDNPEDVLGATLVADARSGSTTEREDVRAQDSRLGAAGTLPSAGGGAVSESPRESIVQPGRPTDYAALVQVDPAHYVRERELARGGMGRIIVARDRRLGREVAIKEVHASDEALRIRFEREARITARLQHPSTISLHEAGVWPTGEPFYAMPLVAGRPLDKVIEDARTMVARLGLLANVLAVADTLAYAHERRIVHRDLKPANVLVGDFGETIVIDWGLAKDLTVAGDDSLRPSKRVLSATGSGSDGATEHGAIIGTPAYMPPEQADGEAVDERADVYALGALLYHVLAGAAPYVGRSAEAVLADVIAGPPRRLGDLVPEAPPELVTIVEKAMARDAADRFPTAKELARELRSFQTGQLVGIHRYTLGEIARRWARKHRTTLAVAGLAALSLALVGAISVHRVMTAREVAEQALVTAGEQRAIAERREEDAQELVSYMMGDLHEKLEGVGKLDLLKSVADKLIAHYDRRGGAISDHDRVKRAAALMVIGDVLVSRGEFSGARAQYEKARTIQSEVLAREPNNIDAAFGVANSHERLTQVALAQADSKAAEISGREAIRLLSDVLARAPARQDVALVLMTSHRALGDTLIDLGDGAGAASAYNAAIDLATTNVATHPDDVRWKRGLAINRSQLGALLLMQGDADGALVEQRVDVEISEQLAKARPQDSRAKNDVAGAHLRLGDILNATGQTDGALAEFRRSLETMKHLTSLDPTNSDWSHDRASCHDRIGNLLLAKKDAAGARAEYVAARDLRQAMVDREPKSFQRRNLAVSHNKLGNVLETEAKQAAALAEYDLGRPVFEAIAAENPENAFAQRDLAVNLYLSADMLLATKQPKKALELHRRALAIVQALVKKDSSNAVWQSDQIESHMAVARVLLAMSDRTAATAELRAGLAAAQSRAALDAQNPAWAGFVGQIEKALEACCAGK